LCLGILHIQGAKHKPFVYLFMVQYEQHFQGMDFGETSS